MHTLTQPEELRFAASDSRIAARIGGISLGITSSANGPLLAADDELAAFLIHQKVCDIELEARFSDRFTAHPGELIFDSEGLWKLYRNAEGFCFQLTSATVGQYPYKQAVVAPDFKSGRIELAREYFSANDVVNPLEYPLDELLWIHRLSQGEGVEVHGCGVIAPDGRGLLLTGHSGAGKSTSSRLWSKIKGARVLSDDRIILRRENGRVWMYGTPWHGDAGIAEADRWPLDGIFVLAQAPSNSLRPLSRTEASAELYARSFVPHHSSDAVAFILEFFSRITMQVPCFEFSFVPNFTAVEVLLRATFGKIHAA
ncbi:MAG TPA: hypothetical protein VGD60_13950 [Candidatus Acidoferrales bacterium]